uniref:Uncharacterized protein n=2 Tax=Oryza glaberrima TaxID=4538 RepID=I1R817_ORYGL
MAEDEFELDEEVFLDIPVDVVHSVVALAAAGGGALQPAQESGGGGGGDALHPERERALHPAEDRGGVALAVEVVPPREPDDEQGTGAGHGGEEEETDIVVGDYMERGGGDDDDVFSSTCLTTVLFTLLSIIVWAVFLYGAAKLCVNYLVPWFRQQPPPSLPSPASHTYDADADMRCPCPCPSDLQAWRNLVGEDGDAYASELSWLPPLGNASAAVLPVDTLRVAAGAGGPYHSVVALFVAAVIFAVLGYLIKHLMTH